MAPEHRPGAEHGSRRDAGAGPEASPDAGPGAGASPAAPAEASSAGRPEGGEAARRASPDGPGRPGAALSRPGEERPEIGVVAPAGRVPYRDGLELQRRLARARIDGDLGRDLLLLVEHDPVLTFGRGTEEGHLRASRDRLEELGVEAVEIERGGDVTYHGPGQLVGYPILHLGAYRKDLHWYLRAVEEALVRALGRVGLSAFRVPDHTGVWVGEPEAVAGGAAPDGARADGDAEGHGGEGGEAGGVDVDAPGRRDDGEAFVDPRAAAIAEGRVRKIASIGVHVSRWVTWHGFALNVTEEPMEHFGLIVPCGIRGVRMTSLEGEGVAAGRRRVREAVATGFASVFGARVVEAVEPGDLPDLPDLSGVPGPRPDVGRGGRGSPGPPRRSAPPDGDGGSGGGDGPEARAARGPERRPGAPAAEGTT